MSGTLTEHDIIAKVGTLGLPVTSEPLEYLTATAISRKKSVVEISPIWLGAVKARLKSFNGLPANWDSYDAKPLDPRIGPLAEELADWFALSEVPPPDVFATPEGGIQFEWHVRGVDIEIDLSPIDKTISFDDLTQGITWSGPASAKNLQAVRKRLLLQP